MNPTITVTTTLQAPISKAWSCWTQPEHITQWNHANDDWHCPAATNDLRPEGKFSWRMEAKDGSMGFDYAGEYVEVKENERIGVRLGDGRSVEINFSSNGDATTLTETFEIEDENTADMQRQGWQAILDNFKKHVEAQP